MAEFPRLGSHLWCSRQAPSFTGPQIYCVRELPSNLRCLLVSLSDFSQIWIGTIVWNGQIFTQLSCTKQTGNGFLGARFPN